MFENSFPAVPLEDIGGKLWVDFGNAEILAQRGFGDVLASEPAFLAWLDRRGIAAPESLGDLALARELRAKLCEARQNPVALATFELVQKLLRTQSRWTELTRNEAGYQVHEARRLETLTDALGPIAESFAQTLANEDLGRLRKCESASCDLYFLDDSKNGRRRWCSMAHCGNRSKAARFHAKNRA